MFRRKKNKEDDKKKNPAPPPSLGEGDNALWYKKPASSPQNNNDNASTSATVASASGSAAVAVATGERKNEPYPTKSTPSPMRMMADLQSSSSTSSSYQPQQYSYNLPQPTATAAQLTGYHPPTHHHPPDAPVFGGSPNRKQQLQQQPHQAYPHPYPQQHYSSNDTYNSTPSAGGITSGGKTDSNNLTAELMTRLHNKAWNSASSMIDQDFRCARNKHAVTLQFVPTMAYPLHAAVCLNAPISLVEKIIGAYPSAVQLTDDATGRLPLHWGCLSGVSVPVLQKLTEMYPSGVKIPDKSHSRVPLHYLVMYAGSISQILAVLNTAEPTMLNAAMKVKDKQSKTPLDLAQSSSNPLKLEILSEMKKQRSPNRARRWSLKNNKETYNMNNAAMTNQGSSVERQGSWGMDWESPMNVNVPKPPGPQFSHSGASVSSASSDYPILPELKNEHQQQHAPSSSKSAASSSPPRSKQRKRMPWLRGSRGAATSPTTSEQPVHQRPLPLPKTDDRNSGSIGSGSAEDPGPSTKLMHEDIPRASTLVLNNRQQSWSATGDFAYRGYNANADTHNNNPTDYYHDSSGRPVPYPRNTNTPPDLRKPYPPALAKPPASAPVMASDPSYGRSSNPTTSVDSSSRKIAPQSNTNTMKEYPSPDRVSPEQKHVRVSPQQKHVRITLPTESGEHHGVQQQHHHHHKQQQQVRHRSDQDYMERYAQKIAKYCPDNTNSPNRTGAEINETTPSQTKEATAAVKTGQTLVEEMNNSIKSLEKQYAKLKHELADKEDQLVELNAQLDEMQAHEQSCLQQMQSAQTSVQKNRDVLIHKRDKINRLEKQLASLQEELSQERAHVESMESTIIHHEDQVKRVEKDLEGHRDQFGIVNAIHQALEEEKADLVRDMANCEAELKSLTAIQNLALNHDNL